MEGWVVSRLKNRGVGLKLSMHAIRESRKKKNSHGQATVS